MWKCVFGEMDMCICLCQNTGAMNRPLRLAECFVVISWVFVALLTIRSQRNGRLLAAVGADLSCPCIRVRHTFVKRWGTFGNPSAAVGDRFIVPAYLYSTCICNPFETHSRNVRNVFVICVLHIRRVKVWFLRCKSMVFGVQKGGFYIAKVWFLECKKGVFIFWLRHSYNVAMY